MRWLLILAVMLCQTGWADTFEELKSQYDAASTLEEKKVLSNQIFCLNNFESSLCNKDLLPPEATLKIKNELETRQRRQNLEARIAQQQEIQRQQEAINEYNRRARRNSIFRALGQGLMNSSSPPAPPTRQQTTICNPIGNSVWCRNY